MAIVACEECGDRVSTQAIVCPHCGAPTSTRDPGPDLESPPDPADDSSTGSHAPPTLEGYDRVTAGMNAWSLGLGVVGMFTYQLIIFPVAATFLGTAALLRHDPGRLTGHWRAKVGVVLGALYSVQGAISWFV